MAGHLLVKQSNEEFAGGSFGPGLGLGAGGGAAIVLIGGVLVARRRRERALRAD